MYKGFRLKVTTEDEREINKLLSDAYMPLDVKVSDEDISSVLKSDSANLIMDKCFKACNANIFLSHSHEDRELARKVASLFCERDLRVFVDSDVWEYADMLLKRFDDKHCISERDKDLYDYGKRNKSTSLVHIMLANALMRMIDKTECFLFLQTGRSSIANTDHSIETLSPWLFHELNIANNIEIEEPDRRKGFSKVALDSAADVVCESLNLRFETETDRLREISYAKLSELFMDKDYELARNLKFLDLLYDHL